jgi:thiamine-monophosphate kinase
LSPAAARALAADPTLARQIAAGGDDYEVLAAVPSAQAAAFASAALAAGVTATRIGEALSGPGITIEGPDGCPLDLARPGWDHF